MAVLVLDCPQWVGPERLADALWGEDPPASRAKVVQGAVSRLRRVLWPDAIVSGPGGYRLDVPPDVIDVRRFESLVERAERLVEPDPSAAMRCLEEAESLWRGRPFNDLGDWDQAVGTISQRTPREPTQLRPPAGPKAPRRPSAAYLHIRDMAAVDPWCTQV